jgi:hypothetical protein
MYFKLEVPKWNLKLGGTRYLPSVFTEQAVELLNKLGEYK